MTLFFQALGIGLVAVILILILQKQGKETATLVSILACCMICIVGITFLNPVIDFVKKLQQLGQLDWNMLQILLKIVGIGLISEIAGAICADSGNQALAKVVQMVASCAILWLALPIFTALIDLVEGILDQV